MCDPACRRLALEIVGEPLELTTVVVDLALGPRHTVVLVVVNQKDNFLSEATTDDLRLWRSLGRQFAILRQRKFVVLSAWPQVEAAAPELTRELLPV